jgi:hypothetical protein
MVSVCAAEVVDTAVDGNVSDVAEMETPQALEATLQVAM